MMEAAQTTTEFHQLIALVQNGDVAAMNALLHHHCDRFQRLARHMLRGFPGLKRWAETDDVLQNAMIRLMRSLREVRPGTPRELFGLATLQIRRELIDLARHFFGPQGIGANIDSKGGHATDHAGVVLGKDESNEPGALAQWREVHEVIGGLPDDEREAVDLLFYQGLSQGEAAELLGVSVRTVQRRWHQALLKLNATLQGEWPE